MTDEPRMVDPPGTTAPNASAPEWTAYEAEPDFTHERYES